MSLTCLPVVSTCLFYLTVARHMPANGAKHILNLGFVDESGLDDEVVPPWSHVCQVYGEAGERDRAVLSFLSSGLKSQENVACFSDAVDERAVEDWLARQGFSLAAERQAGRVTLEGAEATYFQGEKFEPERMLALLIAFHEEAVKTGRQGARIIGEMSPRISQVAGGSRLIDYEARVTHLLREHPVITVCQYDARAFGPAVIMDVLSVHPMVVFRGALIRNPFFVRPEELRWS